MAEQLSARGHQVLVVVTTDCPESKRHLIPVSDYQLLWLKPRPFRGVGMLWRMSQVYQVARRFRPEIIQGQAVSCGLIAAVAGRLLKVPSICYAQGYDVYEASAWQQRTEIRWGCLWPDKLLAVSRHLAGRIQDITGASQVALMPHAFVLPEPELEREAVRQRFALARDERMVFCVGRLEQFKGHDVLLQALPGVVAAHPEASLWIAGSGSQLDELKRQAKRLGIASSVSFVGHLSADDVHAMMGAADLFVLPSRTEPFGIVLLEAMAHGLPVVASNVGGIPEVVPVDGDVQLVPIDDVEALEQAMVRALDVDFAASSRNRQHAMEFEWKRQVVRFESIYLDLLR